MYNGHMSSSLISSPSDAESFTVVIPAQSVADDGRFELNLRIAKKLAVSASAARRTANRYAHHHISYLLRAEQPQIAVLDMRSSESPGICWRVPLVLTLPSFGSVGEIGTINVDVEDGSVLIDEAHIKSIRKSADALAARTAHQTAPAG